MTIETRLREGSEAIRIATRQAVFTSQSPRSRRVVSATALAWAGAIVVVALIGLPAILMTSDPAPSDTAASGDDLGAIGGDGPYWAVADPSWEMTHAWVTDEGDDASLLIYESGTRQIIVTTGWAAEAQVGMESGAEQVATSDPKVTRYDWEEGVSLAWNTSNGTPVLVTFGQMSLAEAEGAADLLTQVDATTFAQMIEASPSVPTTIGRAEDDE